MEGNASFITIIFEGWRWRWCNLVIMTTCGLLVEDRNTQVARGMTNSGSFFGKR